MKNPARKTTFITGANRGLGRALSLAFADAGYDLILHARQDSSAMQDLVTTLRAKASVDCLFFDLSDTAALEKTMSDFCATNRPVDVLVNNAGIGRWGYFPTLPITTVRESLEVNLLAPMRLTQLLLNDMMLRGSGNIINIASVFGIDCPSGNGAYGVSKAALIAFTKTLSAECGQFGIRVNAIAPGMMETDMTRATGEKNMKAFAQTNALRRLGKPEEIAAIAVMMASEAASYVNGQVIRVDGGKK